MGRNLAVGVPVKINVYLKDGDTDKSKLDTLKTTLNKYVKLDLYNVKPYDDGLVYSLKPEIFNKEIYNTFREFYKLTNVNFLTYLIDDSNYAGDYDFLNHLDSNQFKMELVYNYDKENNQSGILVNDSFNELDVGYYTEDWFSFEDNMGNVEIHIHYAMIWFDVNKIVAEDETTLLWFLNKFKVSYFQDCSDLTKSILFYITG